jgi:hypothetical protein
MVTLTKDQIASLDGAVLKMIKEHPVINGGARTMDIVRDSAVMRQVGRLPAGKSDIRYVDGSLQRLRKASKITAAGNRWNMVKAHR